MFSISLSLVGTEGEVVLVVVVLGRDRVREGRWDTG